MSPLWVRTVPFDGTANILTVMLLTLFHLVADTFAFKVVDFVDFFTSHKFDAQLLRVIYL